MSGPVNIALAGGGTAGHVNPLLATANSLVNRGYDATIFGTEHGLESRLVPEAGFDLNLIPRTPLVRSPSLSWFTLPFRFLNSVRRCQKILRQNQTRAVVGFGGYVALPVYLAAWFSRVPIVAHEQNVKPGLANRIGARLTSRVAVTFANTKLPHAQLTGLPMRSDFVTQPVIPAKAGISPTLLVTGGSLGAQHLNDVILASLPELTPLANILWFTGKSRLTTEIENAAAQYPNVQVQEYCDDMPTAYAKANLSLCRAGAGTVQELAVAGLPSVLVPLPIGNGEQSFNAKLLVDAGAALEVSDADLTEEWVRENLIPILTNPVELKRMSEAARNVAISDGAERLVAIIQEAANV